MNISNTILNQIINNLNFGSGGMLNLQKLMPRGFNIGSLLGGSSLGGNLSKDCTGFYNTGNNNNIFSMANQSNQTYIQNNGRNSWGSSLLSLGASFFAGKNGTPLGVNDLPAWCSSTHLLNYNGTGCYASTSVQPKVVAEKEVPSGSSHLGYSFTMYDTGYAKFFNPEGKEISLAEFKQAVGSDWDNCYVDAINSHLPEEREKLKKDSEKDKPSTSTVIHSQPEGIDSSHNEYTYFVDDNGTVTYYKGSTQLDKSAFKNGVGKDWEKFEKAINEKLKAKEKPELS